MKSKTPTIFILFLLATSPALCQEFFVARVLEINPEQLELKVIRTDTSRSHVAVIIADENDLPVHDGQTFFPECVVPGATIRLWGKAETKKDLYFLATDIRGCRKGACSDPTGVRSRLRKIRKHETTVPEWDGEHSGNGRQGMCGHGGSGGNGGGGGGGNR
jgi:uncharacterized membrane protein YgcG